MIPVAVHSDTQCLRSAIFFQEPKLEKIGSIMVAIHKTAINRPFSATSSIPDGDLSARLAMATSALQGKADEPLHGSHALSSFIRKIEFDQSRDENGERIAKGKSARRLH
ncbi:hypothetical protein [Burkholderia lata]|uniref:hypothetical protein n=1 Tax=Burkholderia lata (strain ATCC 17760 / DSM 23089 / LMG 22485 / NCIMB 9086 / R18194 / 383) TaxID=482957 RepID=UPI0015826DB4|nr:hypothetical protein [Burkholderia lata]